MVHESLEPNRGAPAEVTGDDVIRFADEAFLRGQLPMLSRWQADLIKRINWNEGQPLWSPRRSR